jgi:hypothetical protein
MKRSLLFVIIIMILVPYMGNSQRLKNRWRTSRTELHFGIGATNFLGELGGADQIGTNGFKDLEFSVTKLAASMGMRYKLSPSIALNTHLSYGQVAGNDNLTKEFFRNYRNLSFKSHIYEFNTNFEFAIIKEQIGHRYRLRGIRGQKGFEMMAYVFVGAGFFHFNPKGQYEGEWISLRPLHTEGQGIFPTRKEYKLLQFTIPVGFGFKYTVSRRWGIGLEYGIRKTFTDYIDDVSKTYVDPKILVKQPDVGLQAVALADRSNNVYPYITAAGAQRGDPRDLDSYMFAVINLNYKLRTGRQVYPLF